MGRTQHGNKTKSMSGAIKRQRPDFKYSVDFDNGSMTLVAKGKRFPLVEVDGGFTLEGQEAFRTHVTITDIFIDLFERDPITPVTTSRFNFRKNLLDLTAQELDDFAYAMNCLYSAGTIKKLGDVHNKSPFQFHFCPQFLPWHRYFLILVEKEMQKFVPGITMPFWDWTDERSDSFETELLGEFYGGRDKSSGPFSHWNTFTRAPSNPFGLSRPSLRGAVNAIRRPTFLEFRSIENEPIHSWAHEFVGGIGTNRVTMNRMNSPHDPLFYVHHAMIDRVWALWSLNHPQAYKYDHTAIDDPRNLDKNNIGNHIEVTDELHYVLDNSKTRPLWTVLDHRKLGYAYPKDARLSNEAGNSFVSGDEPGFLVFPERLFIYIPDGQTSETKHLSLENILTVPVDVTIDPPPLAFSDSNYFHWAPYSHTFQPGEIQSVPFSYHGSGPGKRYFNLGVRVDAAATGAVLVNVVLEGL